jgi:ribosomal-protein-alanine N-acetyltransferase
MQFIAQTPRFVIRNFNPEDEQVYMSLFDDEKVTLHLPNRNRKEILETFKTALADYTENKPLGRWGIFNNLTGEFIGLCLLRTFNNETATVELGYVLSQAYWGKGIASEMALIMVSYGFTHTKAREIVAVTTLGNTGSQKVLEKVGMERMDNFNREGKELAYFRISR